MTVDAAVDGSRLKRTKSRRERSFYVDGATMAMLRRLCDRQEELAAAVGGALVADPFVFSLTLGRTTSRVASRP